MTRTRPAIEKFLSKVEFTETCWLWTGAKTPAGYGHFRAAIGKFAYAHRWSYEWFVGPIPDGLTIDHLCRVRNCANPDHLEPVSARVNILRSPNQPAANNARKTHCIHGHEFTEDNTRRLPKGGRDCKTCRRKSWTLHNHKRLAAKKAMR